MGWQISLARPRVRKIYPDPMDHVKGYYWGMKKFFVGDRMCFFYAFSKALLFCCSSLASVKCWNVCRDILKSCTMSIKFAEQYIFFGVRVTFSVCHFLGITPSDPLRMLALWSRPAAAGLQELQVSGTAANLRIIAISRKELEKLG